MKPNSLLLHGIKPVMSTDSKLLKLEDSLKEKHLAIINKMSHHELKKFAKHECKQIILAEMTAILPDHNMPRLEETAQCISNAVSREVKSLLNRKSRQIPTDSRNSDTHFLSETVIQELDTTMLPGTDNAVTEHNESIVSADDNSDDEPDIMQNSSVHETTECLDDSITTLQQVVNVKSSTSQGEYKNEIKPLKKELKCCDNCKIKPSHKKKYDMIQCSACMIWYHETCVGISKNDPIGLWFCPTCRNIPSALKTDVSSLKLEVDQLKQTTLSLVTTLKGLSSNLESSIQSLNDRFTALERHMNGKDLCITEKLDKLSKAANNIKTSQDQKSSQILNKTAAVLEKIKEQSENIKFVSEQNKHFRSRTILIKIPDSTDQEK